ncbi:MAG: hypothetical protein E3J72_21065 [Planctomycetota bacterium]|nr:MAG: hypothetical protein E3J72_21065 [Planctomycetota bacterium]
MNRYILPISVFVAFVVGVVIASLPGARKPFPEAKTAKRIVVLTTAGVEILYAMGAGRRIVGVTDYVAWPPEAKAKKKVGGWMDTNFEVITALEPDLLVIQGLHQSARDFAARRGVRIVSLEASTVQDVLDDIRLLGRETGMQSSAEELVGQINGTFDGIRFRLEGRKAVPTLIVLGRIAEGIRQISTCGSDSFLSGLVEIAGGRNVFDDTKGYITISREQLLVRAPEVILDLRPGKELTSKERAAIRDEYADLRSLPAVKSGRVHVITDPSALTAGARVHEIAKGIAKFLHPDVDWSEK